MEENFHPVDYWDYSLTGDQNAETYLRMCEEDGRIPKFNQFLTKDADGHWVAPSGYWKLLIDFKMYDNDGVGAPQMPVMPNFNMVEARRILDEYEDGTDTLPVANDIMERFVTEKSNFGNVQYAIDLDESNWPIVKADRDFALSDNHKEWGKQINAYIRDVIREKGQMVIKTLDGDEIILDAKSQRKAKDWLTTGDANDNRVRKNASVHLDEVVAVSEDVDPNAPNVSDEKCLHEWAKDGWRYREAVFEDYNGKRYLLTLSVGMSGDNQTVYNIGDVKEIEKRPLRQSVAKRGASPVAQQNPKRIPHHRA